MTKKLLWVALAISVIANILLLLTNTRPSEHSEFQQKYPLLSRQLAHEDGNDILIDFDPLRKQVQTYMEEKGFPHSFYLEYLPTGTSIRDGDSNELVGASLMKTPVVMNMYKAALNGKLDLDSQVTVEESDVSMDGLYGSPGRLKPGDKLTLRQVAQTALTESDNTAAYIAYRVSNEVLPIDEQSINNLDIEVQNEVTEEGGQYVLIGSRAYASILKCLYLSCYLPNDSSQEILDYLSSSTTVERIKSGVPDDVKVANKIGSFSQQTQSDCGIVYLPNRPYLMCLMVQTGEDVEQYFRDISKMSYDYISAAN